MRDLPVHPMFAELASVAVRKDASYRKPKAREIARMERRKLVDAEGRRLGRRRYIERRMKLATGRWWSGDRSWRIVDEVVYLTREWGSVEDAHVTHARAIASPKPWTRRVTR